MSGSFQGEIESNALWRPPWKWHFLVHFTRMHFIILTHSASRRIRSLPREGRLIDAGHNMGGRGRHLDTGQMDSDWPESGEIIINIREKEGAWIHWCKSYDSARNCCCVWVHRTSGIWNKRHGTEEVWAKGEKITESIIRVYEVGWTDLSMMTGSEGVSFRFPQLFLSQHRLETTIKNRIILNSSAFFLSLHVYIIEFYRKENICMVICCKFCVTIVSSLNTERQSNRIDHNLINILNSLIVIIDLRHISPAHDFMSEQTSAHFWVLVLTLIHNWLKI